MRTMMLILLCLPAIANAQAPVNDLPCGAITIPVTVAASCTPTTIYQWKNATFSASGTSTPQCGWSGNNKEVWFKFTPANTNCAILFSQAYDISHDLAASVYDAEACDFFYSNTWCSDDEGPDNYPQFALNDLIPGATYYLRLWNYTNTIDSGSAKICIISEPVSLTGKTGINTLFPSTTLDVNGTVKIRGGTPGVNKVLTSDATGNASWKALPPPVNSNLIAFGTYMLSAPGQSMPFGYNKINFGEPEEAGTTNVTAGVFTAPETAVYHFEAAVTFPAPDGVSVAVRITIKNGTTILRNYDVKENPLAASTEKTLTVSATTKLNAGQTAEVQFYNGNVTPIVLTSTGTLGVDRKTRFQGYKVF